MIIEIALGIALVAVLLRLLPQILATAALLAAAGAFLGAHMMKARPH